MIQQKRYAYLIGANGPEIGGKCLKYAEKDVRLMASALKGPFSRCQFTSAEAVIADERQGVLPGLKQYVEQCSPEDVLIIHFSGHAIFDQDLYLVCNHTDINDLVSSAINIRDVMRYLHRCQARYKALILDCCHSGAAMPGIHKKEGPTVREQLHETLQGSGSLIIAACSQREKARELEALDGGAGFLSWAIRRACTDDFDKASTDQRSLSLTDVWRWILTLLKQVNGTLNAQERLPDPMREFLQVGTSDEIWLTHPPLLSHTRPIPKNDELRKQYLEKICTRYHAITLPIGPAEGLSLQAIFQPLALRRGPLTVEDLENRRRRALLGEEREYEDKQSEQHKKGVPSTKEQPVIAEHGEDALRQSSKGRLVILGGPGTGKTTTLKHLIGRQAQRALDDPTVHVPMFLSLADLARSGKTLQSYLLDQVEELGIERSYADVLWNEIKQGHAFVALDSLDEVAPEQRPRMIDLVNSCASEYGNRWIVGSRFTEYKGGQFKQGQFSEWELLPIDATLRRELATKLLPAIATLLSPTATSSPSPMVFVTTLEKHPHAAAWGDNPLLFSLAAVVFVKTGGLPASRAMLYYNVIEAVLTLREQDSIRRTNLLRTLAGLALWLQQGKGRTFTNNDLLTFLEEIQKISWEEAEHIAKRMVTSGILDVVAHDTYGFRHQTFQEYLTAVEIVKQLTSQDAQRREETWQFIWKKRTYSRWTEVLRLMTGALAQLSGNKGHVVAFRWIKALLSQRETEEGDPGELGLVLALKSAVEATELPEWKLIKTAQLERQLVMLWWRELLSAVRNGRATKAGRLEELVQDVKYLQLCDKEAISKPIVLALRQASS